jgi:hypothetical protein
VCSPLDRFLPVSCGSVYKSVMTHCSRDCARWWQQSDGQSLKVAVQISETQKRLRGENGINYAAFITPRFPLPSVCICPGHTIPTFRILTVRLQTLAACRGLYTLNTTTPLKVPSPLNRSLILMNKYLRLTPNVDLCMQEEGRARRRRGREIYR